MRKHISFILLLICVILSTSLMGCIDFDLDDLDIFLKDSEGLEFILLPDMTYVLASRGTCTDSKIVVPSTYEDVPVTMIDFGAFEGDELLEKIYIPSSINKICSDAFYNTPSLVSIKVDKENGYYESKDGVLYTKHGKTLIKYPQGKTDTHFVIPDTVEIIETKAFSHNPFLTGIDFPESIRSLGQYAFAHCKALKRVDLPYYINVIPYGIFEGCTSLVLVNLPEPTTSIGLSAFRNCTSLAFIDIPKDVQTIHDSAFLGCSSLVSISVDSDNEHFTSINGNLYSKDKRTLIKYASGNNSTLFSVPRFVEFIESYAFESCKYLESVYVLENVVDVENKAFSNCELLTVYCEAESKPDKWAYVWAERDIEVVWDYDIKVIE